MTTPFRHDAPGTSAQSWRSPRWWADLASLGEPAADPFDDIDRVVVVAAHPDDEALGTAGLCQRAHAADLRLEVVVATDGQHSHPDSPTTSPASDGRSPPTLCRRSPPTRSCASSA